MIGILEELPIDDLMRIVLVCWVLLMLVVITGIDIFRGPRG